VVKRSYAMRDFEADYGAFKGNAYGLANTLRQTGPLKPRLRSSRVRGLYFAGQLTVPGPGMPPSLVSGELAAGVLRRAREPRGAGRSGVEEGEGPDFPSRGPRPRVLEGVRATHRWHGSRTGRRGRRTGSFRRPLTPTPAHGSDVNSGARRPWVACSKA
jgi:hypothetical protein